ncbi:MAG: PqqD family protein [Erysipelotrichaceae bacterium]|nr:PqqD family protein [Erysipelotrichaceae bacterium]
MKKAESIINKSINGKHFVLPFNQGIQDGMHGIQLNDMSLFLWEHMEECNNSEELAKLVQDNYDIDPEDLPELKNSITSFIDQLYRSGFLMSNINIRIMQKGKMFSIGGLRVFISCENGLLHSAFDDFETVYSSDLDLHIQVICGIPVPSRNGKVVVRSSEIFVMDCEDRYVVREMDPKDSLEFHIYKSGKNADIYSGKGTVDQEALFHSIRMIFLYTAMKHDLYAIHSVSLDDEGHAVLLSALSGTGKSTHAEIWKRAFGTKTINGDLNLIGLKDGKAVAYGMPWCGTSGVYSSKTYPLKAVVLLKRGTTDEIQELTEDQKIIMIQQRMISPLWSEMDFLQSLDFSEKLVKKITVFRAYVTMNDTAAIMVKEYINDTDN